MVPEEDRIELAGFICEAHPEYEVLRVRLANLIRADGTIIAAPLDPRIRVRSRDFTSEVLTDQDGWFSRRYL
jgi:hypothetical protein